MSARSNFVKWQGITERHADDIDRAIRDFIPINFIKGTFKQDTQQATDFTAELGTFQLAVRFRLSTSPHNYPRNVFTIRARTENGNLTEIDKLRAGWGSHYYYCFWNPKTDKIESYVVLDIDQMRACGIMENLHVVENGDGTAYCPIRIGALQREGCVLKYWMARRDDELF